MPSTVEILFPPVPLGVRNTVQTIAELRALDSTLVDAATEVLVDGTGFFNYDPSSLAADNGTTVIKPTDLTSLQAGRWLIVNILNASNITITADDPLAVARSLQDKESDWVNVIDFHDPADGNDITTAIKNAIYFAFPSEPRLLLNIPAGTWEVNEQIIPGRSVHIKGAGMLETILDFSGGIALNATMKGVLSFGLASTLTAYNGTVYATQVQGPSLIASGGSDFSQVSDLSIFVDGGSNPYGIWTAGRLFCANVLISGGGFKWTAGTLIEGVGSIIGNANGCTFYNCQSILPEAHGFFADGTDANAATVTACDVFGPGDTGYFDASFLGNSYKDCRTDPAGTGLTGYHSEGAANRSIFDGCYLENGFATANWDVALPSLIIAPKGQVPVPSAGKNCVLAASDSAGLVTGGQLDFVADLNGSAFGSSSIPALRSYPGGVLFRGQGDGNIYQFIEKGQGIPGTPTYGNGMSIVKRDVGGGVDYELMYLGDTSNRLSLPRDFLLPNQRTPASAAAAGTKGEVCADANFIYVCTATNTWKRGPIATW